MTDPPPEERALWGRAARVATVSWVIARIAVGVGMVVAHLAQPRLSADRAVHLHQGLFTWDGDWYLQITQGGYQSVPREGLRFLPLYPLAARALGVITGERVALVALANLGALVGLIVVWRLVHELGTRSQPLSAQPASGLVAGEESTATIWADRTVQLTALFPAAWAFVFAYAEGPALALTAAYLWCISRRNWWAGALIGLACGLVRPVGVLLAVPAAMEAIRFPRPGWSATEVTRRAAAVAAPIIGLGTYLWWVAGTGSSWSTPIDIQRELRGGWHEPVTRLAQALWSVTRNFRDLPNACFALALLVGLGCCVAAWRKGAMPISWVAFATVSVVAVLSADNIDSAGRYGLLVVPVLAGLGWGARRMHSAVVVTAGAVSVSLFTVLALWGVFVP